MKSSCRALTWDFTFLGAFVQYNLEIGPIVILRNLNTVTRVKTLVMINTISDAISIKSRWLPYERTQCFRLLFFVST